MTKAVITCSPTASIREAARLMYLNGLSGLPVLSSDGTLVGFVSELDLIRTEERIHAPVNFSLLGTLLYFDNPLNGDEIEKQIKILTAMTVERLMSKPAITISSDAPIENIVELFIHKHKKTVPVVDGGKLVGIISRADVVKLLAGERELTQNPWRNLMQKQ